MNSRFDDRIEDLEEIIFEKPHRIGKLSGVPFIVVHYDPGKEIRAREKINNFIDKLDYNDKDFIELDARKMFYSILEERNSLEGVIRTEKERKKELSKGLKSVFFESRGEKPGTFVQKILDQIEGHEVAVMHSVGILYPFSSISVVFSNLENKVDIPFIVFYPAKKDGKTLKFLNETEGSYYRAKVI